MLIAIQVISARVGLVARQGLEGVIRDRFGRAWAMVAMALVVSVNLLTLAADLEGGAAALQVLTGQDWRWFVLPLAFLLGALLMLGGYYGVQRVLRYVLIVFVAYIIAAFLTAPDWGEVVRGLVPTFSTDPSYLAGALALLGTTLTSYVYFWETIEMHEERRPLAYLWVVELDAAVGMVGAIVLSGFIIITTAATLGVRGVAVQTAQDAAQALVPIAGSLAGGLFAVGLLASAVLAIPVLAGTTAYVFSDAFRWNAGMADPGGRDNRAFYLVLLGSLAVAVVVAYVGIEPFRLLFLAGIAGGIGTPVLLALLLLVARDRRVMGDQPIELPLGLVGWLTTLAVGLASVLFLAQQIL
jgi:Mn2+/Fe2+ NRAMP family transporter